MAETKMSARDALDVLERAAGCEGIEPQPGSAGAVLRELASREAETAPELAAGKALARVVELEESGGAPSATWAEVYAELGRATQALRERARTGSAR